MRRIIVLLRFYESIRNGTLTKTIYFGRVNCTERIPLKLKKHWAIYFVLTKKLVFAHKNVNTAHTNLQANIIKSKIFFNFPKVRAYNFIFRNLESTLIRYNAFQLEWITKEIQFTLNNLYYLGWEWFILVIHFNPSKINIQREEMSYLDKCFTKNVDR